MIESYKVMSQTANAFDLAEHVTKDKWIDSERLGKGWNTRRHVTRTG